MITNSLISIKNLSKSFPIYHKPIDIIKGGLFNRVDYDLFWALRDISLDVLERQRVGIIGKNGAGKSTLLQIICGNLQHTHGTVDVRGKISALMSLVPSWNLEESGLENIKLNLLLQGNDSESIKILTEEIIDFTELGGFIYRPVKTYSSGMSARLSFAIATAITPEILIIDEVLGVGDGYFVNKATRRVKELCDNGKALLFVSHSTASVRSMCDKAIWLDEGSIRLIGDADYVVSQYEEDMIKSQERTVREGNMARLEKNKKIANIEDILHDNSLCQFRIREKNGDKIFGYHYVRKIKFSTIGSDELKEVPLFHSNITHSNVESALDLNDSEWGRLYTKKGENCRILTSRQSEKKGGCFSIKRPTEFSENDWPIHVSLEVNSSNQNHSLIVDFLNMQTLAWEPMNFEKATDLSKEWKVLSFKQVVPENRPIDEHQERIEQLKVIKRTPVKLMQVSIVSADQEVHVIKESEPFILRVNIRSYEENNSISVNINIIRADGVFVFYQPSGLKKNIENFVGDAVVDFEFNENPFGAGEYDLSVFVCNGWSWDNIPPSDIFDRSIGVFKFSVIAKRSIPFGLINLLVPVKFSFLDTKIRGEHD